LDDGEVEGLFVHFWGSFNLRVAVGADGWFEFSVILHEPDWDDEWGQFYDLQNSPSNLVVKFAGVE
jgi:hypothetical protein